MNSMDRTLVPLAAAGMSAGIGLARCADRSQFGVPEIDTDDRRMTKLLGRIPGPCAQGLISPWSSCGGLVESGRLWSQRAADPQRPGRPSRSGQGCGPEPPLGFWHATGRCSLPLPAPRLADRQRAGAPHRDSALDGIGEGDFLAIGA